MQRMNDHSRVEKFLTTQMLSVTFSVFSFAVFSCVLFYYNVLIFSIFVLSSIIYAIWIITFLKNEEVLIMNYLKSNRKTIIKHINL